MDECLEEGVCGEPGSSSCANTPGSYTCTCMPRYRLTADRCTGQSNMLHFNSSILTAVKSKIQVTYSGLVHCNRIVKINLDFE